MLDAEAHAHAAELGCPNGRAMAARNTLLGETRGIAHAHQRAAQLSPFESSRGDADA